MSPDRQKIKELKMQVGQSSRNIEERNILISKKGSSNTVYRGPRADF